MKTAGWFLSIAVLASTLSAAQSTPDVIEVPFSFTKQEIFVKATLNGKGPFNLMLDTGCTDVFITPEIASNLGLKVGRKAMDVRGENSAKGYITTLASIRLGDLEARDADAVVQEPKPIPGLPHDGCLGYSVLKRWAVQIDYPASVVRFFSKAPADMPGDVKFRLHGTNLIDDVRVNGVPFEAAIDTGQDFPFAVLPKAAKTLRLETIPGTIFALPKSLTVGSLSVDQPVVNVLRTGQGFDKFSFGVNIGNNFFEGLHPHDQLPAAIRFVQAREQIADAVINLL